MKRTEDQCKRISEATKLAMQKVDKAKLASSKGKHWYMNLLTNEDGLFFDGDQPDGWIRGRYARGNQGINWGIPTFNALLKEYKEEYLTFEELCDVNSNAKDSFKMLSAKKILFDLKAGKCEACGKDMILHTEKPTKDTAVLHHCLIRKKDADSSYWNFSDLFESGHYKLLCFSCHASLHAKQLIHETNKEHMRKMSLIRKLKRGRTPLTQEEQTFLDTH
jgi:hypothetical protein